MLKVAIVMGSKSDFDKVKPMVDVFDRFGVKFEARVLSAHRTPVEAAEFAATAAKNGYGVIVAVAGKAAHLGGVLAAHTTLPVVALPVSTSFLDGLDSVLSILPMPAGIPVAVMGVNAGQNAALFCVRMLAAGDKALTEKYEAYVAEMHKSTLAADGSLAGDIDAYRKEKKK